MHCHKILFTACVVIYSRNSKTICQLKMFYWLFFSLLSAFRLLEWSGNECSPLSGMNHHSYTQKKEKNLEVTEAADD